MKNPYKKVITVIIATVFGFLIAGCGTLGNGKVDLPVSPYMAGRLFVVVDLVLEPVQPVEVSSVIDQVYALAELDFAVDNLADDAILGQIETLYPDASPEFHQMIFNVYGLVKIRLLRTVGSNISIPESEVISDFFLGVEDALELYQPKTEG